MLTYAGCRGKMRKVCTPRAGGEWFTNFSGVLSTHQVGYYARKPILFLWNKFNFQWVYWCNERQIFDQRGRSKYFSYFINCRISYARLNSWWIYDFHIFIVIYLPLGEFICNQHNNQLLVSLLIQLVERCTGIAEVMGLNPVRAWIFSGLIFTISSVVFITARIAPIFVSSTAVYTYDFHIITVMYPDE